MDGQSEIMDTGEAADFLRAHIETVRRLARRGEIPAFKVGKDWRFRRESLLRWAEQHEPRPKAASILVVDDDQAVRTLIRRLVEAEGYICHQAANGAEGLACMATESIDLILLDLKMPRMSGPEFLQRLTESGQHPPVVVVTGYPHGDLMAQAMSYGPLTLIAKPFENEPLIHTIRTAISGVEQQGHLPAT
jgi:excisionase family DNA binding protein